MASAGPQVTSSDVAVGDGCCVHDTDGTRLGANSAQDHCSRDESVEGSVEIGANKHSHAGPGD